MNKLIYVFLAAVSLFAVEIPLKQAETMVQSGRAVLMDQKKVDEILKSNEVKKPVEKKSFMHNVASIDQNASISLKKKKIIHQPPTTPKKTISLKPIEIHKPAAKTMPQFIIVKASPKTLEELLKFSLKNFDKILNKEALKNEIIDKARKDKRLDIHIIENMQFTKENLKELLGAVNELNN